MSKARVGRIAALTTAYLLALGASLAQAGSHEPRAAGSHVVRAGKHLGQQHQRSFWTKKRLLDAKPLPLPSSSRSRRTLGTPQSSSSVGYVPSSRVEVARTSSRALDEVRRLRGTRVVRSSVRASGSIPYSSYEVTADYTTYPYSTAGKIFMDFDGDIYVCSGTAITSTNESVVWTAGHCVYELRTGWVDDLVFVPAYKDGGAPLGIFPLFDVMVPNGWYDYENYADDQAAVIVSRNEFGQTLTDMIGARGMAWNVDLYDFTVLGYPGDPEPKYNGERMIACESSYGGYKDEYYGGYSISTGCDMGHGSSGGGWVDSSGRLNSNVSHGVEGSEILWGPYFDDITADLYSSAAATVIEDVPQPDITPGPVEPPTLHQMRLSLSLKRHLIASGQMTSGDGYLPCTRGAPVGIFRKTSGGWRLLSERLTDDFGEYRFGLKDRAGRYVVYSPEGSVDDKNECSESASLVRVHRHSRRSG